MDLPEEVACQSIKELVGQCVLQYQQHTIRQCGILQKLCLQEMNSTKRQRHHEQRETRLAKLSTKLEINTDTDVNVQDLFSAGKETVTQMEG